MDEDYRLGKLLVAKGYTLSAAESLTGGGFGYTITSHPGASEYFKGAIVTYVNDIKSKFGVKKETLEKYGAVSAQCAEEMAKKAQDFFKSDVACSFTGNAGPTCLEDKPSGRNYIAIDIKGKIEVFENTFSGSREEVRTQCIRFAVKTLEDRLSR